ncbi:Hypothetical predicted protein [Octopus vulgaris]|uniref:Uncharacterized protein n=1 Tax=Octopus vulgaris TaxID=6645 RepID=A0AA36AGQ9_OCTVU|nr:Hypothetical predicted protein [Octopus vulgaris]
MTDEFKMAALLELRQKQRALIELLVAEGKTHVNIQRRYVDNTFAYSKICKEVNRLKDEKVGTHPAVVQKISFMLVLPPRTVQTNRVSALHTNRELPGG